MSSVLIQWHPPLPFPSLPFPSLPCHANLRHEVCSSIEKHVGIFSLCGFKNVVYWNNFKPGVVCSDPAMCWVTDIARVMTPPGIFAMVVYNWNRNSNKWHVNRLEKPFLTRAGKAASHTATFPKVFLNVWQKKCRIVFGLVPGSLYLCPTIISTNHCWTKTYCDLFTRLFLRFLKFFSLLLHLWTFSVVS